MATPREYNQRIHTEPGFDVSINIVEKMKIDYAKGYDDPNRKVPDGTYEIIVDLSECDESKFTEGVTITLPNGGSINCFHTKDNGHFEFHSKNGRIFYCKFG